MNAAASSELTCPIAPVAASSRLLGIVGPGGRVVFTPGGPRVTRGLRAALEDGRPLETRFRFHGPCAESACGHWRDEGVCAAIEPGEPVQDPPECGIRPTCRWWRQFGPRACGACPGVVSVSGAEPPVGSLR
ncbi:hypothetical protein Afil01_49020 [Actinorhabdospora filicis]|uniref:Uncharacterized protein n=1 Tax=Actinorhabdospora filicis TaxID=1785913 RepID=A0A9W6SNE7_9ACTN|nr:hypothetical protein Afil01_49020 [Actinorhabdospora filicis]